MNVHTDVDIGNQVAARKTFELLALGEAVYGAHDDVAGLQLVGHILPSLLHGKDPGAWLQAPDHAPGDFEFGPPGGHVAQRAADKAVAIRVLDVIGIGENVAADAEIGKRANC